MAQAPKAEQSPPEAATVLECPACGASHLQTSCAACSRPTQGMDMAFAAVLAGGDELSVGQPVGDYHIVRLLGRGGMGTVFLAEHRFAGTRVALKVLHRHLAADAAQRERFRNEARLLGLVGHPGIVAIYDVCDSGPGRHYLTMEYLEGTPLSAMVGFPLEPQFFLPVLVQVCGALEAAHALSVVHRDLKPDNVLLAWSPEGEAQAMLVDFGIATLLHAEGDRGVIGPPEFMAPEQWDGPIDARADIYALGVMAYLLATGVQPFAGGGAAALYRAHRMDQPVPPSRRGAELPDGLEATILRALAKRPDDRFSSAGELRAALERVLAVSVPLRPRANDAASPAAVEAMLARYEAVAARDYYGLAEVPEDADCATVRRRARMAADKLRRIAPGLPEAQRLRAESILMRMEAAVSVLGSPAWRAAHDAERGNFRGAAQCLGTGLGGAQLEGLRAAFAERHPQRIAEARVQLELGRAELRAGRDATALAALERALVFDPLDPAAHELYWPLLRETGRG